MVMYGSNGIAFRWYLGGTDFAYRLYGLRDNEEMLTQGRHLENAKRKREHNYLPCYDDDYLALQAALRTIDESEWPEWAPGMLERLSEARFMSELRRRRFRELNPQ